jgi:hypothetical protein
MWGSELQNFAHASCMRLPLLLEQQHELLVPQDTCAGILQHLQSTLCS